MNPVDVLRHAPVFEHLPVTELEKLVHAGQQRVLKSGAIVFHHGDTPDGVYVLLEGRASVFRPDADGAAIPLGELSTGSLFGEMALFDSRPRSASVACLADSIFLQITRPMFFEILRSTEQGLTAVMATLSARVRDADSRLHEELMERERIKSEMELDRHRSLSRMVAGVAHEVNTPLGIVNSASSMMGELVAQLEQAIQENNADDIALCLEDLREVARLISGNITRASELVGRFKNLSYQQASGSTETVVLSECLNETLALYAIHGRRLGMDVRLKNLATVGAEWTGQAGGLSQILMNLLTNAQRYAYGAEGGIVEVELSEHPIGTVKGFALTVRDFGRGIPEKDQNSVFEPFFTTGRAQGGTGLGLAIVRTLVLDSLHGEIDLHSRPGLTEFRLTFPAA